MNWFDLAYLKEGSCVQRQAYNALVESDSFTKLKPFTPVLVGTFPLNLVVKNSDLDIICTYTDRELFKKQLHKAFRDFSDFHLTESDDHVTCTFHFNGFPFEVYGSPVPVLQQNGYIHRQIEYRLLQVGGKQAFDTILMDKESGLKTEPAFAKYFNIPGENPYQALLKLERFSYEQLVERFMHRPHSEELVIRQAQAYVKAELAHDYSGHDWPHIERVSKLARTIALEEKADLFICELAALLHDVADVKRTNSEQEGLAKVNNWLVAHPVRPQDISHIMEIISTLSFKGGQKLKMSTLEGRIVQDADRLDAIGAIGIARVFAYSGAKGRTFHDPSLKPRDEMTEEEYRSGKDTAINHFYEKLLKLKGLMNTDYGKKLAEQRHHFMLVYLDQFDAEWNGER
jgi:uncharacterized protein